MKLNVAQVLGLNTDQKAAQVISEVQEAETSFFAVLNLSCDDAFTKGRQALQELSDFYFDLDGTSSEKLTQTFEEAKKKFIDVEFDLVLSAVSGKVLYFLGRGEVELYLKRGDKLSSLLTTYDQLVSGFLEDQDKLFIATKNLSVFLGESLKEILSLSSQVFEEEVLDRIGTSNKDIGLAALLIEVESDKSVAIEEALADKPQEAALRNSKKIAEKIVSLSGRIFFGIKHYFPKSNRGRLILAVILLVLIATGALLKYKSSRDQQRDAQFSQILQEAKDDLASAKTFATLNPQEAKVKLDSAKNRIDQALKIKPQDPQAQNLKTSLEQESSSILQKSEVSQFPLFLDMDLVKKDFKTDRLSLSAGKLLLLDEKVKTLVVIDLAKKSNQILAGADQLGQAKFASLNGDLAFVYSEDKGILRVDTSNQKSTTVAKLDKEWGEIRDLYGFAGNVYLLDTNQIWKYLPTTDGYSDKREYLTTKADLTLSSRMQIESSVYILKSGGEILRFTRGEKDHFALEGLDKGVSNPKSLFISSETDNLYLLDSGNSRLLILTKTGSYKGQYMGEKFAQASDLVVDEKGKKVYLLDGSKIYTVDLK